MYAPTRPPGIPSITVPMTQPNTASQLNLDMNKMNVLLKDKAADRQLSITESTQQCTLQ